MVGIPLFFEEQQSIGLSFLEPFNTPTFYTTLNVGHYKQSDHILSNTEFKIQKYCYTKAMYGTPQIE
jgi:hypothetical protein